MVSEDTHKRTEAYLFMNDYFGMRKEDIHFIVQKNVPALIDSNGNFALVKE
jgi:UDP-N-acetylglucosamine pyrophosphorylase